VPSPVAPQPARPGAAAGGRGRLRTDNGWPARADLSAEQTLTDLFNLTQLYSVWAASPVATRCRSSVPSRISRGGGLDDRAPVGVLDNRAIPPGRSCALPGRNWIPEGRCAAPPLCAGRRGAGDQLQGNPARRRDDPLPAGIFVAGRRLHCLDRRAGSGRRYVQPRRIPNHHPELSGRLLHGARCGLQGDPEARSLERAQCGAQSPRDGRPAATPHRADRGLRAYGADQGSVLDARERTRC
jgi:hypothetical protein